MYNFFDVGVIKQRENIVSCPSWVYVYNDEINQKNRLVFKTTKIWLEICNFPLNGNTSKLDNAECSLFTSQSGRARLILTFIQIGINSKRPQHIC